MESVLLEDRLPSVVAIPMIVVISILLFLFLVNVIRKGSGEKNLSLKTVLKTIAYISIVILVLIIRDELTGR